MKIVINQSNYPNLCKKSIHKEVPDKAIEAKKIDKKWIWKIELERIEINDLKALSTSLHLNNKEESELSKLIEKIELLKNTNEYTKYSNFIEYLSKYFHTDNCYFSVEADIVNGYETNDYYMYDFIDNHLSSTKKKIKISKHIELELDVKENYRINAVVVPYIYSQTATIQLEAIGVEIIGKSSADKLYNDLLQEYTEYIGKLEQKRKERQGIDFYFKNHAFKIGLICNKNNGYDDFMDKIHVKLKEYITEYVISPMSRIDKIIETINNINQTNSADVICIVRGGGDPEDLAIYNNKELLETVKNSTIPIVVGIGHKNDKLLIRDIATHGAITPTAAGYYLTERFRTHLGEKSRIEQLEDENKKLKQEIALLKMMIK